MCQCPLHNGHVVDDNCYIYGGRQRNTEGFVYCQTFNAKIATTQTQKEYDDFLLARSYFHPNGNTDFWIGLSDEVRESNGTKEKWVWNDGTCVDIENMHWQGNEPNGKTNENCVTVYRNNNWFDAACGNKNHVMCQRPCSNANSTKYKLPSDIETECPPKIVEFIEVSTETIDASSSSTSVTTNSKTFSTPAIIKPQTTHEIQHGITITTDSESVMISGSKTKTFGIFNTVPIQFSSLRENALSTKFQLLVSIARNSSNKNQSMLTTAGVNEIETNADSKPSIEVGDFTSKPTSHLIKSVESSAASISQNRDVETSIKHNEELSQFMSSFSYEVSSEKIVTSTILHLEYSTSILGTREMSQKSRIISLLTNEMKQYSTEKQTTVDSTTPRIPTEFAKLSSDFTTDQNLKKTTATTTSKENEYFSENPTEVKTTKSEVPFDFATTVEHKRVVGGKTIPFLKTTYHQDQRSTLNWESTVLRSVSDLKTTWDKGTTPHQETSHSVKTTGKSETNLDLRTISEVETTSLDQETTPDSHTPDRKTTKTTFAAETLPDLTASLNHRNSHPYFEITSDTRSFSTAKLRHAHGTTLHVPTTPTFRTSLDSETTIGVETTTLAVRTNSDSETKYEGRLTHTVGTILNAGNSRNTPDSRTTLEVKTTTLAVTTKLNFETTYGRGTTLAPKSTPDSRTTEIKLETISNSVTTKNDAFMRNRDTSIIEVSSNSNIQTTIDISTFSSTVTSILPRSTISLIEYSIEKNIELLAISSRQIERNIKTIPSSFTSPKESHSMSSEEELQHTTKSSDETMRDGNEENYSMADKTNPIQNPIGEVNPNYFTDQGVIKSGMQDGEDIMGFPRNRQKSTDVPVSIPNAKSLFLTTEELLFAMTRKRISTTEGPKTTPVFPLSGTEEIVVAVIQTLGCAYVLGIIGVTIIAFILIRELSIERFIHLNQEIALFLAHLLVLTMRHKTELEVACKLASIALQYFFIVNMTFSFLEAVQIYCVMTKVILKGGYFTKRQLFFFGWFGPSPISAISFMFHGKNFVSDFSCWLNVGNSVAMATVIPMLTLAAIVIVTIEAAGTDKHLVPENLELEDKFQFTAAVANRIGLLFVMPANLASWGIGLWAVYYVDVTLYSLVFALNITVGSTLFIFHAMGNPTIHKFVTKIWKKTPCSSKK